MIRADREALHSVARANKALGLVAGEFCELYPDGVPPEAWREVATRLEDIAYEIRVRADEVAGVAPNLRGRKVIL